MRNEGIQNGPEGMQKVYIFARMGGCRVPLGRALSSADRKHSGATMDWDIWGIGRLRSSHGLSAYESQDQHHQHEEDVR